MGDMQNLGKTAKNSKPVQWVYNMVVATSKMLYTIGGGSPDASISQMLGYRKVENQDTWWSKPMRQAIDIGFVVFFNERDHCENSLIGESYVRGLWGIDKELSKQLAQRSIDLIEHKGNYTPKKRCNHR